MDSNDKLMFTALMEEKAIVAVDDAKHLMILTSILGLYA
jgi:hypothetical protein